MGVNFVRESLKVWADFSFLGVNIALVAQVVEHVLGKDEVTGSSPVEGSIFGLAAV